MRMHALVVIAVVAAGLVGCGKKKNADTKQGGTAGTATAAVPASTSQAAPADLPAFLDRFCAAVASGDKAYVTAHADPSFTSEQATDPATCGGRTGKRCSRRLGGHHAELDFAPVCARIKAVPRDVLKATPQTNGTAHLRLTEEGMVSDLLVEKHGNDYRVVRESVPDKKTASARGL